MKLTFLIMRHSAADWGELCLSSTRHRQFMGQTHVGTWWIWDARLTSELILLFIYLAIILFQSAIKQKKVANAQRLFTLVGFIDCRSFIIPCIGGTPTPRRHAQSICAIRHRFIHIVSAARHARCVWSLLRHRG